MVKFSTTINKFQIWEIISIDLELKIFSSFLAISSAASLLSPTRVNIISSLDMHSQRRRADNLPIPFSTWAHDWLFRIRVLNFKVTCYYGMKSFFPTSFFFSSSSFLSLFLSLQVSLFLPCFPLNLTLSTCVPLNLFFLYECIYRSNAQSLIDSFLVAQNKARHLKVGSIEAAKAFEEIFALRSHFSSPKTYLYSCKQIQWRIFATFTILSKPALSLRLTWKVSVNLSCQLRMVVEQYDYYFQLKFDYYWLQ